MRVAFLIRRPRLHENYSVEFMTQQIVKNLGTEFEPRVVTSRFESSGVWKRIYNAVEAAFVRSDVRHIVGDVTYLSYLLERKRTLLTVLDCGVISGPATLRKRAIKLLWYELPIFRSAAVTVISHDVKKELLKHVRVNPDKVHVVPVAVPPFYRRLPREFDASNPVILQIGAGVQKNRRRLFEAVRGLRCRLVLIGRLLPDDRAALEELQLDYVNRVGLSDEQMLEAYRDADILAFPSTYEGFGMPIIEANIVGRPVLAGNVTSMPEVAGDAACLVDPFDVASIRTGLLRIIENASYRRDLVEKGYENAARYDAMTIAKQYEALYRGLARNESE